jgi:hypothetical protein
MKKIELLSEILETKNDTFNSTALKRVRASSSPFSHQTKKAKNTTNCKEKSL